MTNDKSYHLDDPLQTIIDKVDALRGEIEILKVLVHIKKANEECVFFEEEVPTKSRKELLQDLDYMILALHTISNQARYAPVTHNDHLSLMMLISSLFKAS